MTASWTETASDDPLRHFSNSLTPAARHHLDLNYQTIRAIRQACERLTPVELARIVSKGIGWHTPANAPGLILYRLKREAGALDDGQEMTD